MGALYNLSFSASVLRRVKAFYVALLARDQSSLEASPEQIQFLVLRGHMTRDDAREELAKRGFRSATFREMHKYTKVVTPGAARDAADMAGPGPILSLDVIDGRFSPTLNCDMYGHVMELQDCTYFPHLRETDVLAVVRL